MEVPAMHDAPRRRSYWQAALGGCVALQALAVACLYTSCSKVDRAAADFVIGRTPR